jgi:hypothetical protein
MRRRCRSFLCYSLSLLDRADLQTFPIMPNLLSFLARSNPHVPTYVGTTLEHWVGYHSYFQGMLYGFSWGVVSCFA